MGMETGVVKWFNTTKGYGFITPDHIANGGTGGRNDIFVHISVVSDAGLKTLEEGQKVSYVTENNNGKVAVKNISLQAE